MRRKIRAIVTAAACACVMATVLSGPSIADSDDDLEDDRDDVKGQIGGAKERLQHTTKAHSKAAKRLKNAEEKLATAKSELSTTQDKLSDAKATDQKMQAKLDQTEAQLSSAKQKLSDGKEDLKDAEKRVKQFTLRRLETGHRGLRAFGDLMRGQDPMQFSETMSLNESVGDVHLSKMQQLDASRVMLKVRRDQIQNLRDKAAEQREEAAENLERVEDLEAKAESRKDEVDGLVGKREEAEADAADKKQAAKKKLNSLENERQRLNAELKRLAEQRKKKSSSNSGGNSGGGNSGGDGGSALSMPLPGNPPVTSPYGRRYHPIFHRSVLHDGTDLGAGCGTNIYAAASGTVLKVYRGGGYGNRVVVDHGKMRGKNVVTTYNHMSSQAVSPGQHVTRGSTVLGSVGQTGQATGCHLHFMVITNGSTTNPMGWL